MAFTLTNTTDSGICIDQTKTISHTHSGDLLVVSAGSWDNNSTEVQSVTYNGVSLTKAVGNLQGGSSQFRSASIWYLVNPSQGTNDLVLTMTSISTDFFAFRAYSFQGCLTTDALEATGSTQGTGTTATISINSAFENCLFVDAFATDWTSGIPISPARDNYYLNYNTGLRETHATSYTTRIGTTGSQNYSYPTDGGSRTYVYVGATFNSLDTGGSFLYNLI